MTGHKDNWSEYWQQEGTEGEVFVSCRGERHPALAEHWRAFFESVADGASVLDIASGAGSIYASLPDRHAFELYASDISAPALEQLSGRIANVTTVVSSADRLPFADRTFDVVVSQFGVEYAGPEAFAEAARVIAAGGRLSVLAHVEDGYIDASNKAQLAEAKLTRESGFIERAIELTEVAFGGNAARLAAAEQAFMPLIQTLGAATQRCRRGVHSYLLAGFRRLYENRLQYDLGDIVGWLEGMDGEVNRAIDRLTVMRAAASSEAEMATIRKMLSAAGFGGIELEPFAVRDNKLPLAWNLQATRSE